MKRAAELHAGGLAEVVQELLVFVRDNEATLSVKPAELGRPSAGCIASLVSAGGGAHITSVGGTPELALAELHRMAITEPGHVQAVQTRVPLTREQRAARVASLSRVCAPREHLEDIDCPGHCLWCGHVIERVKVTTGDAAGTHVWRVVLPAGVPVRTPDGSVRAAEEGEILAPNMISSAGDCPVCGDERTCARCR